MTSIEKLILPSINSIFSNFPIIFEPSDKLILEFHSDEKKYYKDFIENYINNVKTIAEDTQKIIKKSEFIIPIFRYKFSIFFLFLPLYIFIFKFIFFNKNKKI